MFYVRCASFHQLNKTLKTFVLVVKERECQRMLLISSEERKKLDSLTLGAKRKSGQWESERKNKSGRPEKK